MLRMLRIVTILLAAVAALRAETPADAVRAMVEAERNFFQTGQEKGTRAAFLEFLADDSIVFRPGPLNGKEVWSKRAETGLDLVWEPTFAAISRSGDFGYGWTLGVNVQLEISSTSDVTLTLNGQRRTFYFTPPFNILDVTTPAYTAEPGMFGA